MARLTQPENTSEMFYNASNGDLPEQHYGTKLNGAVTAEEAIVAANMDWNVITKPVYFRNHDSDFQQVEGKAAIVRQDDDGYETVFGVMSNGYHPVQNTEAFSFFDSVIGQGEAIYHSAGSFLNGSKVWIMAKLPEDIEIVKGDVIQPYILLSNSHDGSSALRMQITPMRLACWNMLSATLKQKAGFYAKHTRNVMQRATEAREVLGLAHAYYEMFAKQVDELVNTKMTALETQDYLQQVYDFKDDVAYAEQDYRLVKAYESTLDLLGHPTNTLGGIQGTRWAAFNAVTYYIDHERPIRGRDKSDKRLDASWFGKGAELRQKAFNLLTV